MSISAKRSRIACPLTVPCALCTRHFVGVSLCYLSWLVGERHPESIVVSIDPNLPHRQVDDPQSHALALLDHFGLLSRNLIITGYSFQPTEEDAGLGGPLRWLACENVLPGLQGFAAASFDLVLLDGRHEEDYLAREIAAVRRLLAEDGVLVLDDVQDWPGVAAGFTEAAGEGTFVQLGDDGRVGILQLASL